uniref:Copia protein n=1 Tax=Tanacetum cinerariifolium TaxID=118510 RepID=A0A699HJH9_TANCI|nr:copia protein [Tanacetum cinerariifolium]
MHVVKRIFRYLKDQPTLVLWYPKDSHLELIAYFDSDYAGASLHRKSTTGGCQFLGSRLISWHCKKQTIVANSTTKAEYIVASNCYRQVLSLQNQLLNYGYNFMQTKIHVDNESAICVVKNLVYRSKTKHIEIRHHVIRVSYEKRLIEMVKIHTDYNVADLLTKAFDVTRRTQKDTELPQTSVLLKLRADEAVHQKEGDSLERAITTDASLEAAQARGTSAQTRFERVLKQPNEPPLIKGHTSGSREGRMEHIVKLRDTVPPTPYDSPLTGGYIPGSDEGRLTLLELMNIYTTLSNKRSRAVIHSSNEEEPSMDIEDSPKQGRMIKELDKDEDVNLVTEQGEVKETTESLRDDDYVTLAETLLNIKRSAKKDKGKGNIQETKLPKKLKKREMIQLSLDEELAQKLYAKELAKKAARQEQEKFNLEKALELQIQLDQRKEDVDKGDQRKEIDWNDTQVLRYHALQNRPFSKAKVRKNMFHTFVPKDSGIEKEVMKRVGFDLQQESSKKQKLDQQTKETEEEVKAQVDNDQEVEEMKLYMRIIPDEDIAIEAIPLATKPLVIVEYKIIKEGKIRNYKFRGGLLGIMDFYNLVLLIQLNAALKISAGSEDRRKQTKSLVLLAIVVSTDESLNVTFDESAPPTKLSPLVDDDVGEEEAIRKNTKILNTNNEEDESIEVDEIVNIKEQAPKAWYNRLKAFLTKHEYSMGIVDNTLFTKKSKSHLIIVQIYVDDIIFGSTSQNLCDDIAKIMHDEFEMSMMGEFNFFLGLQIKQIEDEIFFNQSKYVKEMLKKFELEDSKPTRTSMLMEIKLTKDDEADAVDNSKYRENSKTTHLEAVKRIFWYIRGTSHLGLRYLKGNGIEIVVYADSDHAGDYVDRKSTSGVCTKMPSEYQQDYKKTCFYAPKIYNDPNMFDSLRDTNRALEIRYVHGGRTIDPCFYNDLSDDLVAKFTAIGFDCLLSLDEQICPRFIFEFYKTLKLEKDSNNHFSIQFVINNHHFNLFVAQFSELTHLLNQGICIYSDAWGLDELEKTLEKIKPYNSRLPALDDIRNLIHRRTVHEKIDKVGNTIDKLPNQIETNELFDNLRPCELVIRENVYSTIANRDHTQAVIALMKMSSLKAKQPKKPPPKRTGNVEKSKWTQLTTSSLTESPPSDNRDLPSTKLSPRSYHTALKDDPNMSKEQRETRGMFKNLGRAFHNFARMLKKGCH